ncbi:MAG: PIN domain-containing protein [Promicromonosporaceae bacterium]|nr:PIN domain-containing protein [Promicromonosporaceae bacterium]
MPTNTELPDVNVLLALVVPEHDDHQAATTWFQEARLVATTPLTETGLVRLLMNPSVMDQGVQTGQAALRAMNDLREQSRMTFIVDDTSLAAAAVRTLSLQGSRQVTDLHLLNVAVTVGATLVTFDARIIAPLTLRERRHVKLLGN